MEGLGNATPFAKLVAESLGESHFTLLDVGCSSGIDSVWRVFGDRLRAFGFDPNLEEVARLSAVETLPGVTYIPAFVGIPANDQGAPRMRTRDFWARNPWGRLSVARTLELGGASTGETGTKTNTELNLWTQVPLANPDKPVILPEFLHARGVKDVDFIKIDVDGPDLLILRSLRALLADTNVIGVGVEVNFFGSDDPDIHSFHNVDRFLKGCGFELFGLSTRHYSLAALPAPYVYRLPAQSLWGRPLQGDAIYFRDAAAPEHATWAMSAGPHKLAKLAALFSITELPDCAAEILKRFDHIVEAVVPHSAGLECLAAQCVPVAGPSPSYAEYIAEFEANSSMFYPTNDGMSQLANRNTASLLEARSIDPTTRAEVEARNRHLASLAARELNKATDELEGLRQEVAALRASTSWKLTAPFRSIVTALKGS